MFFVVYLLSKSKLEYKTSHKTLKKTSKYVSKKRLRTERQDALSSTSLPKNVHNYAINLAQICTYDHIKGLRSLSISLRREVSIQIVEKHNFWHPGHLFALVQHLSQQRHRIVQGGKTLKFDACASIAQEPRVLN